MKVLIVEDERPLRETIEIRLRKDGFTTFSAESAEEGMFLYRRVRPDILVLDIMLPNRPGTDLCKAIRKESSVPIIFLTARAADEDRLRGFELGADDYIVKPFNLAELSARIKAVLKRSGPEARIERVESGTLVVDPSGHDAFIDGEKLSLTPREFALLHFLMSHPGQAFTREALLDRVWGPDAYVTPRTVDVHVRWLRTKIETDPESPKRIVTLRGLGYKFVG
jgi:DNA-binding response OmpR family regulator